MVKRLKPNGQETTNKQGGREYSTSFFINHPFKDYSNSNLVAKSECRLRGVRGITRLSSTNQI